MNSVSGGIRDSMFVLSMDARNEGWSVEGGTSASILVFVDKKIVKIALPLMTFRTFSKIDSLERSRPWAWLSVRECASSMTRSNWMRFNPFPSYLWAGRLAMWVMSSCAAVCSSSSVEPTYNRSFFDKQMGNGK
jgi:hypothetical protein